MTDQPDLLIPWESPEGAKPMDLAEANEEYELEHVHVKAEDLKGKTFIILGAKPFQSAQFPNSNPFFCLCTDDKRSELFTTTLGGEAVTKLLSRYVAAGGTRPLRVTLVWNEGGRYGGYYTLQ
jgi:hypothetical protein